MQTIASEIQLPGLRQCCSPPLQMRSLIPRRSVLDFAIAMTFYPSLSALSRCLNCVCCRGGRITSKRCKRLVQKSLMFARLTYTYQCTELSLLHSCHRSASICTKKALTQRRESRKQPEIPLHTHRRWSFTQVWRSAAEMENHFNHVSVGRSCGEGRVCLYSS